MDEITINSRGIPRVTASLMECFSGIVFPLGMVGLYSVLACSVTQRTSEIGIRMALGTLPSPVMQLTLKQGLGRVLSGMVIGLIVSAFAAKLIAPLLFGLNPINALIYGGVILTFALGAIFACVPSADRAAKINPRTALRSE